MKVCVDCGSVTPRWLTDVVLWDQVVGAAEEVLCLTCFSVRAQLRAQTKPEFWVVTPIMAGNVRYGREPKHAAPL